MVINEPIPDPIFDDKVGDEYLIHGMGKIGYGFQGFMDGLTHEFYYYEHFEYGFKNYKQIVDFYEYDVDITEANEILETPIDWTGLDKAQAEDEENKVEEEKLNSNNEELVDILINKGEGPIVEFKSSLVAYKNTNGEVGYSRHIKFKITKTIASFLNSKGGFLLIGVMIIKVLLV